MILCFYGIGKAVDFLPFLNTAFHTKSKKGTISAF